MKKYNTKKRLHKKQQLTEILFILFLIILPVAVIGNASVRTLQAYDEDIATAVIQPKNHISESNKMVVDKELTMKEWVKMEIEKAGLNFDEVDCLIQNESSWNPDRHAYNISKKWVTLDRGLVQWNDKWHPEVSNACAYNYKCAVKELIRVRKADGNYNQWHGYTNNNCQRFK